MLSKNEIELFEMIYENDKPEQAVMTAINIFAAFLEQLGATPEPLPACPLESA